MKKLFFAIVLVFSVNVFASNLDSRVARLENQLKDVGAYIEENCTLQYEPVGSSGAFCLQSFVGDIRINVQEVGMSHYVYTHVNCYRYRLVCH